MRLFIPYFALVFLLFQACQAPEVAEAKPEQLATDSTAIQFLLYPQEGLLELWTASPDAPEVLLDSFSLGTIIDFPIGLYHLQAGANGLQLTYPNVFYKEKMGKKAVKQQLYLEQWVDKFPRLAAWEAKSEGKRVLVMAEEACFGCPHWVAELYSKQQLMLPNRH